MLRFFIWWNIFRNPMQLNAQGSRTPFIPIHQTANFLRHYIFIMMLFRRRRFFEGFRRYQKNRSALSVTGRNM
jgi:hypothetical protein